MRRALFLGLPLACFLSACTYDNGDARRILNEQSTCAESAAEPVQTFIDTNAQIETQPGRGAGVYVEYAAGGHWLVRTTCDTVNDPTPCTWDIVVTPEDTRSISNVVAQGLESTDSVDTFPEYPRSYQLVAETGSDIDGIAFDTEPGTTISVDAFLDGTCALPYFFWVGDGAAHTGSPSNPLVLIPTPE
jgi:hypothetical protein